MSGNQVRGSRDHVALTRPGPGQRSVIGCAAAVEAR
jgi:hypothetical protein